MNSKPRRRWWQFRLRTLLVAVVLLSIPLAWVAYSLSWMRERELALFKHGVMSSLLDIPHGGPKLHPDPPAPGCLGLFGEEGVSWIAIPLNWQPEERERIKQLFPEADIDSAP